MTTKQFSNLIAGEWVAGSNYTRNVNPSDTSEVIGEYAQAAAAQTAVSSPKYTRVSADTIRS